MTTDPFLQNVHPSWQPSLERALSTIDPTYLAILRQSHDWLPGSEKIFRAFSLPFDQVKYVLFGESPYPRRESANGFAFWDAAVTSLWSTTGLSKKVNRATSLRNIIKMLLIAEGVLDKNHVTQEAIAMIDKRSFVQTNDEFFANLLQHGFLLLNATPVLQPHGSPQKDARAWLPFMKIVLDELLTKHPKVQLILWGRIANTILHLLPKTHMYKFCAEHPYNLSFVTDPSVIAFFKPFHLLQKNNTL